MPTEISLGYTPRPQFIGYHKRKTRWAALVCHRRAGKTVGTIADLIDNVLRCPLPNARGAYIAPTFVQAKDVAWEYVKRLSAPIPGVQFNESELRVDYPTGARIRLYGADNYDRMRGLYFDFVVLDEYADMSPAAWSEVIRPALADRKGSATFIGTPKGRNAFYDICEQAKTSDDWFYARMKASETGIVDPLELADARASMTAEQYATEFECSFDSAVIGSYYGGELDLAHEEGRIGKVPYDAAIGVSTYWDLGLDDATAVWWVQTLGKEIRLIKYREWTQQPLTAIAKEVLDMSYTYSKHVFPHDIRTREMTTGRSREEVIRAILGTIEVAPNLEIVDGINAARTLFGRFWIDDKECSQGLECLRNYRKQWDEKKKTFQDRPFHDWACFTGETEVLTRNGKQRIMDLKQGEVLTPCGWKPFKRLGVTGRNAPLVEVTFSDGYTVKCTPEHMFMTDRGWKSAEHLAPNTPIQSSLTISRSIGMAVYTAFGPASGIIAGVARSCIERLGRARSGLFRRIVTSITSTATQQTTQSATLNAYQPANTFGFPVPLAALLSSHSLPETAQPLGTEAKRAGFGTSATPSARKAGRNGSVSRFLADTAQRCLMPWFARMAEPKSTVQRLAKPLHIVSVKPLPERSDVWCIEVPEGSWFSLANGAVVHNSHGADALRYFAVTYREKMGSMHREDGRPRYGRSRGRSSPWAA